MGVVGTLKFLGEADFKEGLWAGIQLDILGSGKNDGSVKGIRYFACPPQTGLFVLASKLTPLDQDTDSERSLSPSRAAKYIGLTASQLNQQNMLHSQPNTPITSPVASSCYRQSLHQVQSPTPTHTRGMPSPAMTPTQPSLEEEMIADMRMPSSMTESPQDQLTRELKEDAPDDLKVQQLQLQLRVDVLEAENHYLKLENAQNKTAEKILERSLVLKGQTGQELFTLEGHQAIVEEIKSQHTEEAKAWELSTAQTVQRLETRILALETEQLNLITERDQSAYDVSALRKEKSLIERHVCELGHQLAEAMAAAQAGEERLLEKSRALQTASQHYFQPGLDGASEHQMQLELEEVHQKMSSLRDAANAKDIFLNALSEQVEVHRNAAEEKEREIRRVKTEAERQNRDRERIEEELKAAEAKWLAHQNCPLQDSLQHEYASLKETHQAECVRSQNYQERIRALQEMIDELKRAGMESIELYESSVEKHRVDREKLDLELSDTHRKLTRLETERDDLRKAGREAIETFETTIADMKAEREQLVQDQNAKREALQLTIDSLKKEIEQLMNNAATEELKEVWEKERNRLTEQVQASTEAYEKQIRDYVQLQKEADLAKEQVKDIERITKDKSRLEEQLVRFQSDYDQQLASRTKYLEEVRSAVESQKKAEAELRRMTEQKEKLERDLQDQALSHVPGPVDIEKYQWEKLKAQNAMLLKQKEQAEMAHPGAAHYQKQNKQLLEKQLKIQTAQKRTEETCLRLTDEIGKLRQEEERKPTLVQLEGLGTDQKQKLEQLNLTHTVELRKLREKETSEEKDYNRHLESLIESKIFKEEELEEALDKERKLSRLLQGELQDLKDDMENQSTLQKKTENHAYCDICEIYGHDLSSCSKVVSVQESEQSEHLLPEEPLALDLTETAHPSELPTHPI
ncbi:hypothetical protein BY458DRAFT_532054 [Sporodiniella umbellata]|nr:hypothetical protein BY458DRAFT_532054 [Sporodiniella umbellata]